VGLIARVLEEAGVPTLIMTSAWDITRAMGPPRAAFLHAPLGHQTGPPGDPDAQRAIVRAALEAGVSIEGPGEIVDLEIPWPHDPGWEARAYSAEHVETDPNGKPKRG
jgi:D-proline reductase (dithiol) PrdB